MILVCIHKLLMFKGKKHLRSLSYLNNKFFSSSSFSCSKKSFLSCQKSPPTSCCKERRWLHHSIVFFIWTSGDVTGHELFTHWLGHHWIVVIYIWKGEKTSWGDIKLMWISCNFKNISTWLVLVFTDICSLILFPSFTSLTSSYHVCKKLPSYISIAQGKKEENIKDSKIYANFTLKKFFFQSSHAKLLHHSTIFPSWFFKLSLFSPLIFLISL